MGINGENTIAIVINSWKYYIATIMIVEHTIEIVSTVIENGKWIAVNLQLYLTSYDNTIIWFPKCPLTINHIAFGKTETWSRCIFSLILMTSLGKDHTYLKFVPQSNDQPETNIKEELVTRRDYITNILIYQGVQCCTYLTRRCVGSSWTTFCEISTAWIETLSTYTNSNCMK